MASDRGPVPRSAGRPARAAGLRARRAPASKAFCGCSFTGARWKDLPERSPRRVRVGVAIATGPARGVFRAAWDRLLGKMLRQRGLDWDDRDRRRLVLTGTKGGARRRSYTAWQRHPLLCC
ncbi:MAG: hypothetical protein KatS3mg114_0845 [Planctomycetaceae bacterium]|nr:MAG: hypothetical protein KatS3mg114_0845 [Planctomycetaceae bacterium]